MRRMLVVLLVTCLGATAEAEWRAVQIAAPGSTNDAAAAERAARAYLAAHRELGDFTVADNRLDGALRTVGFTQTWRGVPVIDGQIAFVFAHDRLFAISVHPRDVPRAGGRGHAVVRGRLVDIDERGEWTIYRDPDTGREISRKHNYVDATGTLEYDAGTRYASGVRASYPAPDTFITANGSAATTADDGTFAWTGSTAASVMPGLIGSYVQIINQAGTLATATLTAQPGAATGWSLAGDEISDAQLSTYIYASRAKAKARLINPAVSAWLDQQLPFYVNETGISCNAFTTTTDLHFFRGDSTCENTGRVADIVFHEFGHALHFHSLIAGAGQFELNLTEGLADFNAANLTEDPGVGRGLYYDDSPVRQIDPYGFDWRWPDDNDVDAHLEGRIISGALWDLRTTFIRELGHDPGVVLTDQIFAGVMQRAADIPSAYTAALVADDDDANLANGTPHYCEIQRAFGPHGIADANYQRTIVSPPVVDGQSISVSVATPVQAGACPVAHVTSIEVGWQPGAALGGTFRLDQQGDTWTGTFPDVAAGTIVTYSIDATLDDGSHVALPENPADPMYQMFAGIPREIWCEHFETDPHWPQTGGEWQWGAPFSPPLTSHDPPSAHGGTGVWGTKLDSTGLYDPSITTTTTSPQIDVSAYQNVHLQYWRWLSVEDATYDQATILANGQPVFGNPKSKPGTLDFVDREWRFHDIDVTPFIAEDGSMQLTWTLASDDSKQLGGWTLDDVCLVGIDKLAVCGDSVLDDGEQCDDGNTNNGDGCSATCRNEIVAGGGGGCSAAGDPSALILAGYAWLFASRSRRRTSRSSSGRLSART
jgi:cysteine-rich repeat protein